MGAQQSADADEDCRPCFGIETPFKRNAKLNDPLGSPLPDIPASRRKQREFSSRYDGLEKETSSASNMNSLYGNVAQTNNSSRTAGVFEGSVRERLHLTREKVDDEIYMSASLHLRIQRRLRYRMI